MNLIMLAITALLVWILQIVLRRAVNILDLSSALRARFRKILPGTFALLWVFYGWLAVYVLFGAKEFYPLLSGGMLLLLLALAGWYLLRDVIAGVAFMTKHPGILHHRIGILDTQGKVVRIGPTSLSLRTDGGEILSIPYSRVAGESFADFSQSIVSDRFTISFPIGHTTDLEDIAARIRTDLLLLPWINPSIIPIVKISRVDTTPTAEVTFHSLNEEHAALAGEQIRKRYEQSPGVSAKRPMRKKKT